jgi:hypothetical protein
MDKKSKGTGVTLMAADAQALFRHQQLFLKTIISWHQSCNTIYVLENPDDKT